MTENKVECESRAFIGHVWESSTPPESMLCQCGKEPFGGESYKLRCERDALLRERDELRTKLNTVRGCDHLDTPYRKLLEERDVLVERLNIIADERDALKAERDDSKAVIASLQSIAEARETVITGLMGALARAKTQVEMISLGQVEECTGGDDEPTIYARASMAQDFMEKALAEAKQRLEKTESKSVSDPTQEKK